MSAFGYWTLSTDFLGLVEAASLELVKRKNAWVVVGDPSVIDQYDELTRWSDHRIGVPLLFNFFHGIELMLKGFLSLKGGVPKHHRLTDLHAQFLAGFAGSDLDLVLSPCVIGPDPSTPLGQFFTANGIDVDDWFQALKYPESTSRGEFDHVNLQYGGVDTIAFWDDVGRTAIAVRIAGVELAKELGEV